MDHSTAVASVSAAEDEDNMTADGANTRSEMIFDDDDRVSVTARPPLSVTEAAAAAVGPNGSSSTPIIYRRNNSTENDFTRLKARFCSEDDMSGSSTKSFLIVGGVFVSAICALALVYLNFPRLDESEKHVLKLPTSMDDAKALGDVLSKYTDTHFYQVLFAYFATYVFLQSFAIPGSIFLSILSGFLFPFPTALLFVCLSSATGASFCYLLSYLVGRRLVWRHFPKRAAEWSSHVQKNREHLLNYMIFLRITPFLPNWFINITSPVINVPLAPFFFGTFLGVAPPSFVAIKAGITIHQLTSSRETVTFTSVFVMAVLAIISLLPVIFKDKLRKKFD